MNVNHWSQRFAMSTRCVQIQRAHMSAAVEEDTKEMEGFAQVNI